MRLLGSENIGDDVHVTNLNFFHNGRFYIHGHFDETISTNIIPHLFEEITIKSKYRDEKITFMINSLGGYVHILKDLLGLIEVAKSADIAVETLVFGNAYSCGSMLAIAGTPGLRFVGKHAEHLCHLGSVGSRSNSDAELNRNTAKSKAHFNFVRDLYKEYAKIPNLEEAIKDDNFYVRGRNIIKFGLADEMI